MIVDEKGFITEWNLAEELITGIKRDDALGRPIWEIIPKSLAENAGHDPIDIIVALRAEHGAGKSLMGVDVFAGKTKDMVKAGVLEPLRVKIHAIRSAAEVAALILRIDDVIAAKRSPAPAGPTGGMPPGMGGMPPGMPPGMM